MNSFVSVYCIDKHFKYASVNVLHLGPIHNEYKQFHDASFWIALN